MSAKVTATENGIDIDGERFAAAIIATAPQHAGALWARRRNKAMPLSRLLRSTGEFEPKMKSAFPLSNTLGGHSQWIVERSDGLLAFVLSGHGPWEDLDDAALVAHSMPNTQSPAGGWHKVIREKRATFSAIPGLRRSDFTTSSPRLFLAGDYTWSGTIRPRSKARYAADCAPHIGVSAALP